MRITRTFALTVVIGLLVAPFVGEGLSFVAPAVNTSPPKGTPAIIPFLFITIACGSISGFHCLVSSGTTSKQLRCETDATVVGYGSMLLEGGLAIIMILAPPSMKPPIFLGSVMPDHVSPP